MMITFSKEEDVEKDNDVYKGILGEAWESFPFHFLSLEVMERWRRDGENFVRGNKV